MSSIIAARLMEGSLNIVGEITEDSSGFINMDGNLDTTEIIEGLINVPVDAYYYPLDISSLDDTNNYGAFDLSGSIDMDWSIDWTICYFKKPVLDSNDNIESLGSSDNINSGYVYWGKENSSNSYIVSNGSSVPFTNGDPYFDKWQMISLQKNGATVNMKYWTQYYIYSETFSTTSSFSDYYSTQHGYDFKLNGNACYRDLIVVKRCMSDDEVKSIFSTQLSNESNGVYIQGTIIEDASLI